MVAHLSSELAPSGQLREAGYVHLVYIYLTRWIEGFQLSDKVEQVGQQNHKVASICH